MSEYNFAKRSKLVLKGQKPRYVHHKSNKILCNEYMFNVWNISSLLCKLVFQYISIKNEKYKEWFFLMILLVNQKRKI